MLVSKAWQLDRVPNHRYERSATSKRRQNPLAFNRNRKQVLSMDAHRVSTTREPAGEPPGSSKQRDKRRACFYWKKTGMCRYGSSCRFAHDEELAYKPPDYTHRQWSHAEVRISANDTHSYWRINSIHMMCVTMVLQWEPQYKRSGVEADRNCCLHELGSRSKSTRWSATSQ